jgi:hypothetical protein
MTDHKKRLGTRDAVETAIDLSKADKNASWKDLLNGKRPDRCVDPTLTRAGSPPVSRPVPPSCRTDR